MGTIFGTDGSGGKFSKDPLLRRCGYSAVTFGESGQVGLVFGGCPGRHTVPRAELYALSMVIRHSIQPNIKVYVDPGWLVKR